MIRHVVMFKFAESFTPTMEREWLAGVDALRGEVPGLRDLSIGRNVLGSARPYDYAIVADFESLADVAVYAEHPLHRPVLALSGPHSEHIVSVDFELPGTSRETP